MNVKNEVVLMLSGKARAAVNLKVTMNITQKVLYR